MIYKKRTVTVLLWYRENVEFGWSFLQTRKTQRSGIEQTAINLWGIYLQHREYFVNVKFKGSEVIPPLPLADPWERQGHAPSRSNFFSIFMQFSIKLAKIIGWRSHICSWRPPIWQILDPPLITSWLLPQFFNLGIPKMDWGEVISPGYIVCGTGEATSIF